MTEFASVMDAVKEVLPWAKDVSKVRMDLEHAVRRLEADKLR